MHDRLPPDLARLGEHLADATERDRARRRRNALLARLGATGAAAALTLAVFAPGALHSADGARTLAFASAGVVYRPVACDRPRGAQSRRGRGASAGNGLH